MHVIYKGQTKLESRFELPVPGKLIIQILSVCCVLH